MSYTEEQYDALVQENMELDKDTLHDEYMSSHTNLRPISNMAISENRGAFEALKEEMDWGTPIDLEFIINNRCPYYKFFSVSESETKSLHLNKEIINYIYNYIENNNLSNIPTDYAGAQNAGENYILHLLKRDSKNGKLSYDHETGYKAIYNSITINYGRLPYTPEELDAKLNSLG